MHWILHWIGLDDPSGPIYLFWSGFAGNVGLIAAFIVWYWHHICHINGCYRFGFHQFDVYRVCRKHHPGMKPRGRVTYKYIMDLYKKEK